VVAAPGQGGEKNIYVGESWAWWFTAVIPTLRKQENLEFKASLDPVSKLYPYIDKHTYIHIHVWVCECRELGTIGSKHYH
jgi:hypothetical protein